MLYEVITREVAPETGQDLGRTLPVLELDQGGGPVELGSRADGRSRGDGRDTQEVLGGGLIVLGLVGHLTLLVNRGSEVIDQCRAGRVIRFKQGQDLSVSNFVV